MVGIFSYTYYIVFFVNVIRWGRNFYHGGHAARVPCKGGRNLL